MTSSPTRPSPRVEPTASGDVLDLDGEIVHDSYRTFAEHAATVDRFSAIAAAALAAEGKRASFAAPWGRGAAALFKGLVLKLGFLDGWRGLLAAWMSARYDFLKYRRLRQAARTASRP